jgi:hypothetical protein
LDSAIAGEKKKSSLERLEPYAGKLARTVLGRAAVGKTVAYPTLLFSYPQIHRILTSYFYSQQIIFIWLMIQIILNTLMLVRTMAYLPYLLFVVNSVKLPHAVLSNPISWRPKLTDVIDKSSTGFHTRSPKTLYAKFNKSILQIKIIVIIILPSNIVLQ